MTTMSEERIEAEHHTPAEAEAADTEHHPVADPPATPHPPIVPQGTRTDEGYGAATHIERINPERAANVRIDTNGKRWLTDWDGSLFQLSSGAIHYVVSYAAEGHPEGVRWPYTLTRPAFTADHVRREAGHMVWLLPHEVAAFHRPVDSAPGGSKEPTS